MSWFEKIRATYLEPAPQKDPARDATVAAIDILMRNSCDMDQCWPALEQTGLPKETISKISNLTCIACAQEAVEALLAKNQIADHYVITDQSGTERTVRFEDCDTYLTAKTLIGNYGQAKENIAAASNQLKIIELCVHRLGEASKENLARIILLPPTLPAFGQAGITATISPVVGAASMAMKRRTDSDKKYFKGNGIDVGGGIDSIDQYAAQLGFDACRNWDMVDGDAQYLQTVPDGTYDFLHSSHCLEHMVDPKTALINWLRVVRPGGYLVILVPDEELYEHLRWPSTYNDDHKWSFTIYRGAPRLPKSVNVFDLLMLIWPQVEIIKVERMEAGYRYDVGDTDQTAFGTAECCIEFILRKIEPADPAAPH